MDDKKRLEEIEARAKAAVETRKEYDRILKQLLFFNGTTVKPHAAMTEAWGAFASHALEDVPWLLSQLAQVQAERDAAREEAKAKHEAGQLFVAKAREVDADCAVLREALMEYGHIHDKTGHFGRCWACEKKQAALSTNAGLPLLRERDELRARVADCHKSLAYVFDIKNERDQNVARAERAETSLRRAHEQCELRERRTQEVEAERDALKKRVAALEAVVETMPAWRICNNTGKWYGSCRFCGDSTFEHECVSKEYVCDHQRCVAHLVALANLDATTEGSDK
jgi:hypothetical protein